MGFRSSLVFVQWLIFKRISQLVFDNGAITITTNTVNAHIVAIFYYILIPIAAGLNTNDFEHFFLFR